MKSNLKITLTFILLSGFSCSSTNRLVSNRTIHNDYVIVDKEHGIYCSKYEVTNEEYRLFLNNLKAIDNDEYNKCKIDSLYWNHDSQMMEVYRKYYSWHPIFDKYPVVNIPYHGALKYCEWLNHIKVRKDVKFRLPTESEFTQLMKTLDISIFSDHSHDYNCPNFNLYFESDPALDGGRVTVDAKNVVKGKKNNFIQHKNGLLHVVGNVSEFLADGRSMGGSWNSFPSEVAKINTILEPNPTTGFRMWFQIKN